MFQRTLNCLSVKKIESLETLSTKQAQTGLKEKKRLTLKADS